MPARRIRSCPPGHIALLIALLPACPAGPGTGTDADTSTGTTTTSASAETTSPASTGPTAPTTSTTDPTSTTDAPPTTSSTTDTTTATTTDTTTGAAACDAIVGSTDCEALVAVSGDLTLEDCQACQGIPCGQDPACDGQYPCLDGIIVLQGCCSDEQCAGVAPFCGMFIATDNICVLSDDV